MTNLTHIVLWNGAEHPGMHAVAEVQENAVLYSKSFDKRLVMTPEDAAACVVKIRQLYGNSHDAVAVANAEKFADQKHRDGYLTAFQYSRKYST